MKSPLERLWKDTCSVYRYESIKVGYVTREEEVLKADNVKCHYSRTKLADLGNSDVPRLINTYSLFCALETDIKEGDKVVITRKDGGQVTCKVGEGFPMTHHKQFNLTRESYE